MCVCVCVLDQNVSHIHYCVYKILYSFAGGLSHMMIQILALPTISSGENIGMLSFEMTIVPALIFTNPTCLL